MVLIKKKRFLISLREKKSHFENVGESRWRETLELWASLGELHEDVPAPHGHTDFPLSSGPLQGFIIAYFGEEKMEGQAGKLTD